ncbi:MAG: alpha/beta fold hydrolase [Nitrospirae bacterium]|nr:alpha/beta fold hydrolase [Nitrospirota bacterium]
MNQPAPFELAGTDQKNIRGDLIPGHQRQILFITGFLSKRWGTKSKALASLCQERGWGFCCFDFRGNGDSEGNFQDYTLFDWLDDAQRVVGKIKEGPPLTIVGSSLGGWLAWLLAQEHHDVTHLLLLAPAFNMMGQRAQDISTTRRQEWLEKGWMPWEDDALHRDYPLAWKWVEESETLWTRRHEPPRRILTTILHGLQDIVIQPKGSWHFVEHLLHQDPDFPIELILKTGDHRMSQPEHVKILLELASQNHL